MSTPELEALPAIVLELVAGPLDGATVTTDQTEGQLMRPYYGGTAVYAIRDTGGFADYVLG